MKYVAIDFETASASSESACSVGLVKMDEEGGVLDRFYTLLSPKRLEFDPRCFAIHHLNPIEIASSPSIAAVWPEMKEFIGSLPLVAHNAAFDITVLRASLASWGIESCHNDYYCTLSLARKLWKNRRSYSLTALAEDLGWIYEAHNALADSEICGRLFARLCGTALYDDETARRFFLRIYKRNGYPKSI